MGTTNLLNYKSENIFLTTDLRVIMAICRATQKICFLTTSQGHLPSLNYKIFFPDDAAFSYLLSKARGSKYMQFRRSYVHFFQFYTANTWLHACTHDEIWPSCVCGGKSVNKSIPKILDIDWIRIALHYVNAKIGLQCVLVDLCLVWFHLVVVLFLK